MMDKKYLVARRDGSIPVAPWFVLLATDRAAPVGLKAYAAHCRALGVDPEYCDNVERKAAEFEAYRETNNTDARQTTERLDDEDVVALIDGKESYGEVMLAMDNATDTTKAANAAAEEDAKGIAAKKAATN